MNSKSPKGNKTKGGAQPTTASTQANILRYTQLQSPQQPPPTRSEETRPPKNPFLSGSSSSSSSGNTFLKRQYVDQAQNISEGVRSNEALKQLVTFGVGKKGSSQSSSSREENVEMKGSSAQRNVEGGNNVSMLQDSHIKDTTMISGITQEPLSNIKPSRASTDTIHPLQSFFSDAAVNPRQIESGGATDESTAKVIEEQKNYIINLKTALKEVLDYNEELTRQCKQMQTEIDQKDEKLLAQDQAIAELTLALDRVMGGVITREFLSDSPPAEEAGSEEHQHHGSQSPSDDDVEQ